MESKQDGHYAGEHQGSYKLSVCDTQKEKRNFPGYTEKEIYTLADMQGGDGPGTTDSDLKTHGKQSGPGYTKIYGGKPMSRDRK